MNTEEILLSAGSEFQKSKPFAKVFDTDEYGQVLVMKKQDDEGAPAMQVTVVINDVEMSSSLSWEDSEGGCDMRDKVFAEKVDENFAVKYIETQMWDAISMLALDGGCEKEEAVEDFKIERERGRKMNSEEILFAAAREYSKFDASDVEWKSFKNGFVAGVIKAEKRAKKEACD